MNKAQRVKAVMNREETDYIPAWFLVPLQTGFYRGGNDRGTLKTLPGNGYGCDKDHAGLCLPGNR